MAEVSFYVLGALALAFAIGVVLAKSPMMSVISLLGSFFCLAVIYLLAGFQFLAAAQILVYAGAILVLFLFVIMLLNLGDLEAVAEARRTWLKAPTAKLAVVLAVGSALVGLIAASTVSFPALQVEPGKGLDDLTAIAIELFGRYSLAFEAASILLLASMVAVMVLAKRQRRGDAERGEANVVNVPTTHLLYLAAGLFSIGVLGFLLRRNVIVVLMCIELMLNAANLTFLAASRQHSTATAVNLHGPVFAIFVILVAAAEAAVGLALIIALYRLKQTVDEESLSEMKG